MGEDKEKIQQAVNGQGKDKFEIKATIFSVVTLSIFFGFILMAIATTVENSAKSILSIISSIMFTVAAIVIITDIVIKQILHQNNIKKIVLSVFAILFIALCTGILIVSGINTVYTTEILSHIVYWLVAVVMIVVSIAVITIQFLINKNDFEQNPIKSYAVIILTMLYALTYAMIVKPDIVFNIAFTIHTIASLVVFINIIFKTGIKSKNIIQLALFVIAVLALMAQMIYCIYVWFFNAANPNLFNSIMGVFAGLLGGVLTLTGVAWTIKRQEETRREDIAKREEERKQEEIAKAKPIFSHIIQFGIKQKVDNQLRCGFRPEEKDRGEILVIGLLENSDNASFILDKMYYKKWYKLNMNNFVLKNKQIYLYFFTNKSCKEWDEPFCYLKVKDMLGNNFYYKLLYVNDGEYKIVLNIIQEITKEEAPDDNN